LQEYIVRNDIVIDVADKGSVGSCSGERVAQRCSEPFTPVSSRHWKSGSEPELVRTTIGGNGTTFDLQGRLIVCEGDDRRLTRMGPDGKVESLVDNYKGGRFNRPNDVICHSNGCLYFTDPDKRRPYQEREIPGSAGEDNLGTALASIAWRRPAV
jgi:sugar lactone lactonase YvrE